MTVFGAVFLLGGMVSVLAGFTDRRRRLRVLAGGHSAWALIAPASRQPEYDPSGYRPLLRFDTEDGRPVEVYSPVAPSARRPLVEGRKILVHYDYDDPSHVVVYGERGRDDLAFVAVGMAAIAGAVVAFVLG